LLPATTNGTPSKFTDTPDGQDMSKYIRLLLSRDNTSAHITTEMPIGVNMSKLQQYMTNAEHQNVVNILPTKFKEYM